MAYTPHPVFAGLDRPLLFAHRGASRQAPENTLESFDLAARLGADVLEMDVHMTADGEVVVLHDATLQRTTDGHGPVATHSYHALSQLDAGCRFITARGSKPFVGRGVVVPRLEDVLRAFPQCGFNIELKQSNPPIVRAVLQVLEKVGPRHVLLAAGVHSLMHDLEAAQPGCALGLSAKQAVEVIRKSYVGHIPAALHGRALQIPPTRGGLPLCTGHVLKVTKAAQIDVHLWTINSPQTAQKYLARGVSGIMTDDPGALSSLFVKENLA